MQPLHVETHVSLVGSHSRPDGHATVPATHASRDSSHVSLPLHATPSLHARADPPHVEPVHVSPAVQNIPSSQLAPSFALNDIRFRVGSHTRHEFDGSSCPMPKQEPPITHPVHVAMHASLTTSQISPAAHGLVPAAHVFAVSSHVSVPLHATPSPQRAPDPTHTPPEHASLDVQYIPSSHDTPSSGLNAVLERDASHTSHGCVGVT